MQVGAYSIYGLLLLASSFVVFRVLVRLDYRNRGKLTVVSSLLETAIFGLWAWFAYVNAPADWPTLHASLLARIIGWPLFAGGMGLTLIAMLWLDLGRSFGQHVGKLQSSGVYAVTRNPQAVAFAIGIVGYVILWPTWQGAVAVLLLAAILHMMILTEEEHLRRTFGDEYDQYTRRVPRYVAIRRINT